MKDREAWCAAVNGVEKVGHEFATEQQSGNFDVNNVYISKRRLRPGGSAVTTVSQEWEGMSLQPRLLHPPTLGPENTLIALGPGSLRMQHQSPEVCVKLQDRLGAFLVSNCDKTSFHFHVFVWDHFLSTWKAHIKTSFNASWTATGFLYSLGLQKSQADTVPISPLQAVSWVSILY